MMKSSRQKNSILNASAVFVCKTVQIFLSFAVRRILIINLGEEILGLDGLFSSILQILSLADLGINTAIVYSLYKPIAESNEKKIAALVSFFKRFYFCVGVIIICFGIIFTPFLTYVINFPNDVDHISLYFMVTILGTASSYFLSSRRIIFEADQRNRIVTVTDMISAVLLQLLQLVVIRLFNRYIVVLVLRITLSITGNIIIYLLGNMQYPYLSKYEKETLDKQVKKELFKNTGAVLCHKIGGVFVTGTDSLIISTFISTIISGYYSNYLSIINSVSFFVTGILNALIPSIGDLKATSDDIDHHHSILEEVVLINYCMSAFCTICLVSLINPFIVLWVGEKFLFNIHIVILLCTNFYISTMRFGVGTFCTAAGLFKETLVKPIAEGIINLVVSLAMVKTFGVIGIFFGTFISLILGSVWVDPFFLYKKWFKRSSKHYFITYTMMLVVTCILCVAVFYISSALFARSIACFFARTLVVIVLAVMGIGISTLIFPGHKRLFARIKGIVVKILESQNFHA